MIRGLIALLILFGRTSALSLILSVVTWLQANAEDQFLPQISEAAASSDQRPTPEEIGDSYKKSLTDYLHIPLEWFFCEKTEDCVIAHVPCNTGLAINKKHQNEAENLLCHGPCSDACLKSTPDTSRALCRDQICHTLVEHYQIPLPKTTHP